jgi:hypothetical protein
MSALVDLESNYNFKQAKFDRTEKDKDSEHKQRSYRCQHLLSLNKNLTHLEGEFLPQV